MKHYPEFPHYPGITVTLLFQIKPNQNKQTKPTKMKVNKTLLWQCYSQVRNLHLLLTEPSCTKENHSNLLSKKGNPSYFLNFTGILAFVCFVLILYFSLKKIASLHFFRIFPWETPHLLKVILPFVKYLHCYRCWPHSFPNVYSWTGITSTVVDTGNTRLPWLHCLEASRVKQITTWTKLSNNNHEANELFITSKLGVSVQWG